MWFRPDSLEDQMMMISRSIRRGRSLSFILLSFLASCTPTIRPVSAPEIRQEIDAVLPASGITWSGEYCRLAPDPGAVLTITGPTAENKPCTSSLFPVAPGHISIRANLAEPITLGEFGIGVRFRIFDASHIEIPLTGHFLNRDADADYFTGVTFSGNEPTQSILFVPPRYPLDGGWIPSSAKFARMELYSDNALKIASLSVSPTKWNVALRDRLKEVAVTALPNSPWQPIAVNVQGTAHAQQAEILEARAHWHPRGPVMLIAQLDPRDLTHDRLSDDAVTLIDTLKAWHAEDPNILFGVSVNPYLNGTFRNEPVQFKSGIASGAITNIVLPFVTAGASLVLLRADDFAPTSGKGRFDFILSTPADKKAFRSLADAHAAFIRSIYMAAHSANPSTSVAFVPPWYASAFIEHQPEHARDYLKYLAQHTPPNVAFVWTGPSVRSLWIDDASSVAFRQSIGSHPIMIWDNTPYARAHKDFWLTQPMRIPLCSMIEPYDVPISDHFHEQKEISPWLLINTGINPINRIQLETAQAYVTLNRRYNPERVLKTLLEEEFGTRGTDLILRLDTLFWLRHTQKEFLRSSENDSVETDIQMTLTALRNELQGEGAGLQTFLRSLADRV